MFWRNYFKVLTFIIYQRFFLQNYASRNDPSLIEMHTVRKNASPEFFSVFPNFLRVIGQFPFQYFLLLISTLHLPSPSPAPTFFSSFNRIQRLLVHQASKSLTLMIFLPKMADCYVLAVSGGQWIVRLEFSCIVRALIFLHLLNVEGKRL